MKLDLERRFEAALFAARWLVAPIYAGLVLCLVMLLVLFARYLVRIGAMLAVLTVHDAVLATLAFIDLTLVANLVLIVIYTGYENFVSRLDLDDHVDRPAWLGKVDFTGLKLKLFSSIVAITGIELLKEFMDLPEAVPHDLAILKWLIIVHLTFVFTAVMAALTEWLTVTAKRQ